MVEDVNFPNRIPPVSATGRVHKVNRKTREQEKPPFGKYMEAEDEKKKKSQRTEPSDKDRKVPTNDSAEPSNSSGPVDTEEDTEKKIIDIRI